MEGVNEKHTGFIAGPAIGIERGMKLIAEGAGGYGCLKEPLCHSTVNETGLQM